MHDLTFVAPPRISRARFVQQLVDWRSPAAAEGSAAYDAVEAEGLDPALGLAFFWHESQAATDPSYAKAGHKNPGNIKGSWGHVIGRDAGGFAKYASWAEGFRAWALLIRHLYVGQWGLATVRPALERYAPRSDGNRPDRYAAAVEELVMRWASAPTNPWAAWGDRFPLPPDQRTFAIPQAWLARAAQLGPALSEEVHYPHFEMAIRWFEGGCVIWYQGWERGVVVPRQ